MISSNSLLSQYICLHPGEDYTCMINVIFLYGEVVVYRIGLRRRRVCNRELGAAAQPHVEVRRKVT